MLSLHVKRSRLLWLHDTSRLSQPKKCQSEMVWHFIGVYILIRTLHDRCSTLEEKFCISARPCNILYIMTVFSTCKIIFYILFFLPLPVLSCKGYPVQNENKRNRYYLLETYSLHVSFKNSTSLGSHVLVKTKEGSNPSPSGSHSLQQPYHGKRKPEQLSILSTSKQI